LIAGNYHFVSDVIAGLYFGVGIGLGTAALMLSPDDRIVLALGRLTTSRRSQMSSKRGAGRRFGLAVINGVKGAAIFLRSVIAKFPSLAGCGDQPWG
jgi:hypothetical protein